MAKEKEAKYTRREILDGAQAAFGVKREVVAGALTLAKNSQEEFTKSEVEGLIKKFNEREVK
jgi:hypothetical protein